jgi:hypothetical protein
MEKRRRRTVPLACGYTWRHKYETKRKEREAHGEARAAKRGDAAPLTPVQKAKEFVSYIDGLSEEDKKLPLRNDSITFSDGTSMGMWWETGADSSIEKDTGPTTRFFEQTPIGVRWYKLQNTGSEDLDPQTMRAKRAKERCGASTKRAALCSFMLSVVMGAPASSVLGLCTHLLAIGVVAMTWVGHSYY